LQRQLSPQAHGAQSQLGAALHAHVAFLSLQQAGFSSLV